MIRRPPRSTRTDTLFPDTTLFRSVRVRLDGGIVAPLGRSVELRAGEIVGLAGLEGSGQKEFLHALFAPGSGRAGGRSRSEEHTSELQSLMRISYAVFCLKKKKTTIQTDQPQLSSIQHTHSAY